MPNFGRMRDSVRKRSKDNEFHDVFGSDEVNTLQNFDESKQASNKSGFKEIDDFLLENQEENIQDDEQRNTKGKLILNV